MISFSFSPIPIKTYYNPKFDEWVISSLLHTPGWSCYDLLYYICFCVDWDFVSFKSDYFYVDNLKATGCLMYFFEEGGNEYEEFSGIID
jgi:hypothetical protein